MKRVLQAGAAIAVSGTTAMAGGIDRSGQFMAVLFEEGRYGEFSLGAVSPSVSGVGSAGVGGGASGDMAPNYFQFGAAYKADLNDMWSYALIFDQPFGADVDYPASAAPYFAAGATAEFDSNALTGILQYNMPSNVSLYGGIRVQTIEAAANIPFVAGYSVTGDRDFGVGYVVGAAFEKPEIALRVALTYSSKISHELTTTETSVSPLGGPNVTTTNIDTPQSVNLEFQTGVAEDTLVFGSVRWVDWTGFNIRPADYATLTMGGSLVAFASDTVTYSLGVGRRLNDQWSVAAVIGYEDQTDDLKTNLAPTDGQKSIGLAATYTRDNMKITGGIRYVKIGDANTRAGAVAPAGIFTGNDALALGVKVGFTF